MNAELMKMFVEIFEAVLLPLLSILTGYLIKFIQKKADELALKSESDVRKKYISMLSATITACVLATNQTYVESLKKQGKFDAEAQKIAFNMTMDAVLDILSEDAKLYFTEAYGDLTVFLTTQIESTVNQNKIEVK